MANGVCELCHQSGGRILWQDGECRVVRVDDLDYPGFCRVVWERHVPEMTDLTAGERRHLMDVVYAVEAALRRHCAPDKINLASFGNMTPHLHWHVIPRWHDDRHFPNPVWGAPQREGRPPRPEVSDAAMRETIAEMLSTEEGGGY